MNSKAALKILRELVDEELYQQIIHRLAGTTVYFPENADFSDRIERNLRIKDDYYTGNYEVTDLAIKYELSVSRIYKILQTR